MDADQLKNNLVRYTSYKSTNNPELKIIENSIINSVISFFRPAEKETKLLTTSSININNGLREETALKDISEMKQVSKNYLINELAVSFMSKAHNDWILAHKRELENNSMKNPEKFVPLELLTNKELKEYLGVVKSIFNCLNIELDEREIKCAFTMNQLIFMIKNEIFTDENLAEKIMNLNKLNPEIIDVSSSEEKSMQDLYAQKEVAENIAENVKERVNLNIADKFKEVLNQNNKIGFFSIKKGQKEKHVYKFSDNISQKKIGFKKQALPKLEKPITKAVYKLARFGRVFFAKNVKIGDYKYYDYSNNFFQFIEYEACTAEQKRAIDRREKKLKKLERNIEYNENADIPGIVSMVIAKKNPMLDYQEILDMNANANQRKVEIIQIPITQRELIKMKFIPEEIGWEKEKKAKINSSDKAFFAVQNKRGLARSEFKDFLAELAKNSNDEKIGIDKIINMYKENQKTKDDIEDER